MNNPPTPPNPNPTPTPTPNPGAGPGELPLNPVPRSTPVAVTNWLICLAGVVVIGGAGIVALPAIARPRCKGATLSAQLLRQDRQAEIDAAAAAAPERPTGKDDNAATP